MSHLATVGTSIPLIRRSERQIEWEVPPEMVSMQSGVSGTGISGSAEGQAEVTRNGSETPSSFPEFEASRKEESRRKEECKASEEEQQQKLERNRAAKGA
jgi:hypothetical protein